MSTPWTPDRFVQDQVNPHLPPHARGYEDWPARVGRTAPESGRAWRNEKRPGTHPRTGLRAPNVIVVLMDDMGYSDIGPFGSEIATPTLDRVAAEGFTLTNYHTTPVCSPARAALLTGVNAHRAGYASVANSDEGHPNLRLELSDRVQTLPEVLRHHGYATFGVGKWHLVRDANLNAGGDRSSWPLQRGFDQYYGSLEGLNSFFHPNQLVRDNTVVDVDEVPEDYYLTDDYTDEAVRRIQELRANDAERPFFLYFAHTAMHGPLGAKPVDLARYHGRYAAGWDEVRRDRHARQIALGVVGPEVELPGLEESSHVPAWDSLTPVQQERFARYMEVYAAMVDSVDQSLGRILDTLDQYGERDNTVVVFTSDNGGTAEGGLEGTRSYFSQFAHVPGLPADWQPDVERDLEVIGGPQAMVHYPAGWASVSNTPFRGYKASTFEGGIRVPFLLSWPAGLPREAHDNGVRDAYQYVTDVLPTVLDLVGLEHPYERHNLATIEVDGASLAPVLTDRSPSTHPAQYHEFRGQRGFHANGWKVVTQHLPGTAYDDTEWQLYDTVADPYETTDLAASHPERVAELAARWEEQAWANTVFPLAAPPAGSGPFGGPDVRRPAEQRLGQPLTLYPGTPRLERYRSHALVNCRAVEITVDVTHGEGQAGVLVAHGDQGGGYNVYVDQGHLWVSWNSYGNLAVLDAGPLAPGHHTVQVQVSPQPKFRAEVSVRIDGTLTGTLPGVWMLVGMTPFSGITVGADRGGPVNWDLYQRHRSFPYTGELHSVHYEPGASAEYDPALLAAVERESAVLFD